MTERYIGLMSGTSLDGVDAAIIDFSNQKIQVLHTHFLPYSTELKHHLLSLQHPAENELELCALIANSLAILYADSVNQLLFNAGIPAHQIRAIGCHGQTIRHRPDLGFSMQIGNAALLAELTNITVISDFRSRDVAAGGQGAPLVPAFHQAIFSHADKNRIVINIGGIANLTYIGKNGDVFGFDSGPGNMLIDAWIKRHLAKDYDENGQWAAGGIIIDTLLVNMLNEPYFNLPAPKSTGRDLFNLSWLNRHLIDADFAPKNVARTLVALTAQSIVFAIQSTFQNVDEVYLCGGGAHNHLLVNDLQQLLGNNIPVSNTNVLGLDIDWVEAACFAWLAKQALAGKSANLPEVTGAKGQRILGAIYPC